MTRRVLLQVWGLVLLMLATSAHVWAQSVSGDDVRRAVSQTHARLLAFFNNLEVSYRVVSQRDIGGRREQKESHGKFRLKGAWRAIESYDANDDRKSIRAYNSRYSFFMGRSKGREQDELFQYDRLTSSQTPVVDEVDLKVQRYLGAAQTLMYYYSLVEFLESGMGGSVTLRSVAPHGGPDTQLVKVMFDRVEGGRAYPCWAIIDRSNHWAVVEAVVQWPWGEAVQTVEYNPTVKEVPFPRRVVYVTRSPNRRLTEREEWIFDDPRSCDAAEESFTLTAYGLPEVSQQHWGLRSLFLFLTALGLAALLVKQVRRWLAERARRAPALG